PRVRSRALQPRRLHPKRTDHRSRFARRGRQAIRGGLREVLIALYLRQADLDGEEARALLGELRRSQPESEGAEQIVTFTPAGKRMALPLEDGAEHSMLFPVPEGTFDVVVVSPQLRFFTNEWSRAFLAQLVSSLRPSGSLWVPILSKRGDDGLWSERWLTQTLGVKASLATSLPLLRFDRIP